MNKKIYKYARCFRKSTESWLTIKLPVMMTPAEAEEYVARYIIGWRFFGATVSVPELD